MLEAEMLLYENSRKEAMQQIFNALERFLFKLKARQRRAKRRGLKRRRDDAPAY